MGVDPMTEAAKPAREPAPAQGLGMFQKLGSLFRTYAVPRSSLVVPTPFRRDDRNCYTFLVPKRWVSDETGTSPIQLYEDGEPLGPGHAGHDDIRTLGRGRFSHWGPKVYFSTSDNSDPNTNGRTYSVVPPEGWRLGRKGVIPQQQPQEEHAPTQDWAEQEPTVELAAGQRVAVEWSLASIDPDTIFRLPDSSFAVAVPHDWPSDAESTSTLMLLEDGKPLPLPHAAHADIPLLGKGRYSHWGGELRFAASDDSDPRVNGRRYEIARADAFLFEHAPGPPVQEQGRCWVLGPLPAEWPSDDAGSSTVALLEDGKIVGEPHASHEDIRKLGGGRYSHWGRQLLFSTSDNSDPTTNGRTYTVVRLEAS